MHKRYFGINYKGPSFLTYRESYLCHSEQTPCHSERKPHFVILSFAKNLRSFSANLKVVLLIFIRLFLSSSTPLEPLGLFLWLRRAPKETKCPSFLSGKESAVSLGMLWRKALPFSKALLSATFPQGATVAGRKTAGYAVLYREVVLSFVEGNGLFIVFCSMSY